MTLLKSHKALQVCEVRTWFRVGVVFPGKLEEHKTIVPAEMKQWDPKALFWPFSYACQMHAAWWHPLTTHTKNGHCYFILSLILRRYRERVLGPSEATWLLTFGSSMAEWSVFWTHNPADLGWNSTLISTWICFMIDLSSNSRTWLLDITWISILLT